VAEPFVDVYGKQSPLTYVSGLEYWTLDRTAGSSSVAVTLYWVDNNRSQFWDVSDTALVVAHNNGSIWVSEAQASRTGSLYSGSITSQSVGSFSPFTFGSLTLLNTLPVTLLSLEGKQASDHIQILWSTATEINTDHFTVEKSLNGNAWMPIGQIQAAGNSNSVLKYMQPDFKPQPGTQFYRLKLTSTSGEVSYSHTIAVKYNNGSAADKIYPNPANESIVLSLNATDENPATVRIYNSLGLKIYEQQNMNSDSMLIDIAGFNNGLYIVEVEQGDQITRDKLYKY
jgi:hypothetical protein